MAAQGEAGTVFVSVVLPCLNEGRTVGRCVEKAWRSLRRLGLAGEVVVADNGSSDASVEAAVAAGGRVVPCVERGYGAAIFQGIAQTRGTLIVVADADDSYDLENLEPFLRPLLSGEADMVMGNRFAGGIEPGAMPWKNRYLGNPFLSGLLRCLYGGNVHDAHCGLRAFTRQAYDRMQPVQAGMEFASELVVRALELGLRIVEVPTRLFPDGRGRKPHLRPWRDGWRHLRYLVAHKFTGGAKRDGRAIPADVGELPTHKRRVGDPAKPAGLEATKRFRRYEWFVRAALAILLLVAAGAKLHDLYLSTPGEIAWYDTAFSSRAAIMGIEAWIGAWLATGRYGTAAWLVAAVLFLAMAAVNAVALQMGWSSCGCFGAIEVPPSVSLACNVAALFLLATIVPSSLCSRFVQEMRCAMANTPLQIAGFSLALGVVPPFILTLCLGSVSQGLAYLDGHRVFLYPQIIDAGVVRPSKSERTYFTVWNRGREPIRVVGGTSECTCVATRGLPVTVPPGGSGKIPVDFAFFPTAASRVSRNVKFFVDAGNWLVPLQGIVKARLLANDAEPKEISNGEEGRT